MAKRLTELVERFVAEPTPANREAFHRGLMLAMVWTPLGGQPADTFTVYTDSGPLLDRRGQSAGGGPARGAVEQALAAGRSLTVATGTRKSDPRVVIPPADMPAILSHERIDDPELGAITWQPSDESDGFWEFAVGAVTGVIVPPAGWPPPHPADLPRIRKTVRWALANDLPVRQHIADRMWGWWREDQCGDPDPQVSTREQFGDRLELEVIRFEPGAEAMLVYADNGLVSGYGIRIWVTPTGRFTRGPEVG
jgi:hypothetical protein